MAHAQEVLRAAQHTMISLLRLGRLGSNSQQPANPLDIRGHSFLPVC